MEGNKNMTQICKKWLKSVWKDVWKTFILNFNKSASIYKEEEKLEADKLAVECVWWMRDGGGGTYYKNVKRKPIPLIKILWGKEFSS
jgi:hypothetical protein